MERSRRPPGAKRPARIAVPVSSRLAVGGSGRNRRRSAPLVERLPRPTDVADACRRLVRRAAPGMIAAGSIGVLCGAIWLAHHFVTTSAQFAIESIEVRGATRLDAASVRALVDARPGQNIFSVDTSAIEAALAADAWIARAQVHRELPHTLVAEITEERPAAAVDLDGLYLAAADGRLFKRAIVEHGEGVGLPVITGIGREVYTADPDGAAALVRSALDAAAAWQAPTGEAARPAVGEIHVDTRRGLTLYTRDGAVAIRLGEIDGAQLPARLRTFDAAWASLGPDEQRRARAVHLDNRTRPDHVTVAFARN